MWAVSVDGAGGDGNGAPTIKQIAVLRLVAAGYATKQIATLLSISEPAVKKRLTHLMRHYGVPNRAALVRAALGDLMDDGL